MPGLFGFLESAAQTIGKNLPSITSGLTSVFAPQSSPVQSAERQAAAAQAVRPGLSRAQLQGAAIAGGVALAGVGGYAAYRGYRSRKSGSRKGSRRSF